MSDNETIADIIAEMRKRKEMLANAAHSSPLCYSVDTMTAQAELLDEFTDSLEAAWERERVEIATTAATQAVNLTNEKFANKPVGNAAAMREALESADSLIAEGIATEVDKELEHPFHLEFAREKIASALSAPPRNCDIYPTNEDAWRSYQLYHAKNADAYVEATVPDFIDWLFAPAEKGGAE